ncbi:MAG: hypothetical protein HY217_13975 [Candidatus Rokubacteria bacterium]|nr:hypothetical protein [Candidatus Rokubacteria bacterium]
MLALELAGCATAHGEIGKPFKPEGRKKLAIGGTTRADVRFLVGDPLTVAPQPDGREMWIYEHTRIDASRPLIGPGRARQTPHVLLTLRFQYGILMDCSYFQEDYRSRGMEITTGASRTERCGQ